MGVKSKFTFARFIKGEVVKERVKEVGISGLGEEELTLR
jgi:hypothetical protein